MPKLAFFRQRFLPLFCLFCIAAAVLPARAVENAAVEARILDDLRFLTSDDCEGRGITTKGINRAADYIADEFKKIGLAPAVKESYFQPFEATGSAKLGANNSLVIKGPLGQTIALEMGKHFTVVAIGGTGRVAAPLVFAGYGITAEEPPYDDFAGLDVAGKVVVVLRKNPREGNRQAGNFDSRHAALQTKASNAEIHKAVAVIFVNDNGTAADSKDRLMDFSYTAQSREGVSVPVVHLRRSLGNMMVRSVFGEDLSLLERNIDRELKPRNAPLDGWSCELQTTIDRESIPIKNVVGVLEGSGPQAKETVVIGAHYDHLGFGGSGSLARGSTEIHRGADDNASGTACLIELARRFASIPNRQGRRLVFIAFTGEESGLLGSAHYCKQPLYPLSDTVAMINMDMVGRLREDKLTVYGTGTAKNFDILIEELNRKHQFKINKVATGFGPSDHASFYGRNIPVYHFFTGIHAEYHRPTDTTDTVNVPGIRRVTDLIEETVTFLAMNEMRPEYVKVGGRANVNAGPSSGPRLGIRPDYTENDEGKGVLLDGVSDDTPAAKAGMRSGDRLVDIAGKPVKNLTGYMTIMAGMKKGDEFEVIVLRDNKPVKLKVMLE